MRNGTSQSPFRPALGRQLVRAADAPLRGHGFGTSRLRQTPTTNGLTAYRMRLHLACVSSGTYGPFATSASRSRLRLPRTTRLALRASLAGSGSDQVGCFICNHFSFHRSTLYLVLDFSHLFRNNMVGLNDYVHLVINLAQGFSVMIIETKVHTCRKCQSEDLVKNGTNASGSPLYH